MANTTFRGPIRQGVETGVTATRVIGHDLVTQIATVNGSMSGASNIVLPQGADIVNMTMVLTCAASAATSVQSQGISWRIGRVAGNDAYFATIKTSAIGVYQVGGAAINLPSVASAPSWVSLSADTQVFIDVTALTSADDGIAQAGGRFYISYFPR